MLQINLSTCIDGKTPKWTSHVHAFYGLVSGALLLIAALTYREAGASPADSASAHGVSMPVTFTVDAVPAGTAAK